MTEWLTTGQMIDRLKVGEVAENNSGFTRVFYDFPTRTLVYDINGNLSKKHEKFDITMDSEYEKWRIIPKYVSFEEAKTAYEYGEIIKCEYVSAIDETKICTQTYKKGTPEYEGALSWHLVTEGKWIIVGESNG